MVLATTLCQKKLIEELGLQVDESVRFGVYLGDGCRVSCQRVCRGLRVDVGACQWSIDGYLFELGGVDLILGVEWLGSLGEVQIDWNKMIMKFIHGTKELELQGDPSLTRSLVSLRSLIKTVDVVFCGAVWDKDEQRGMTEQATLTEVEKLLAQFSYLFETPKGLPPERNEE